MQDLSHASLRSWRSLNRPYHRVPVLEMGAVAFRRNCVACSPFRGAEHHYFQQPSEGPLLDAGEHERRACPGVELRAEKARQDQNSHLVRVRACILCVGPVM